jgi:RNA 2',3'-cyclic 3'-phosphodiesterase
MMKRLFIAIKIVPDQSFTAIYRELITKLSYENLRFVEPEKLHLTLRFLGDTEEEKIPDIDRLMKKSAEANKAFTLNINNAGVFGSSYNPRVIWFGIDPNEDLTHLHTRIETDLTKVGFFPDRQNFVPHLTLSRVKQLKDLKLFQKIIGEFREKEIMKQDVTEFSLIESILLKEGPIYTTLNSYTLKQ